MLSGDRHIPVISSLSLSLFLFMIYDIYIYIDNVYFSTINIVVNLGSDFVNRKSEIVKIGSQN